MQAIKLFNAIVLSGAVLVGAACGGAQTTNQGASGSESQPTPTENGTDAHEESEPTSAEPENTDPQGSLPGHGPAYAGNVLPAPR
jgi:hypothetical protein